MATVSDLVAGYRELTPAKQLAFRRQAGLCPYASAGPRARQATSDRRNQIVHALLKSYARYLTYPGGKPRWDAVANFLRDRFPLVELTAREIGTDPSNLALVSAGRLAKGYRAWQRRHLYTLS